MPINTLGPVVLWDGENPRTFTGRAREVISGGDLVVVSGAAAVVSSGADTFVTTDIIVSLIADSWHANGIALNTVGSNGLVTVATRGAYIARAAGLVSGGQGVVPISGTTQGIGPNSITVAASGTEIGRAITASASGTALYAIVDFRF
jgi:hypothetical protein